MSATVSKYALGVIDRLQGEGKTLTPVDIIRLNALGLRVENPRAELGAIEAPAAICVSGVWFHEPTIQSLTWFENCACCWWRFSDAGLFRAMSFSMHKAREPYAFTGDLLYEGRARKAVSAWWKSLPCTKSEIDGVMDRLLRASEGDAKVSDDVDHDGCDYEWLLTDLELATHQSRDRWLTETLSYCLSVQKKWYRNKVSESGGDTTALTKTAYLDANAAVLRLCQEIRNRG